MADGDYANLPVELDRIERALATAATLDEVLTVRGVAETFRDAVQTAKLSLDVYNQAASARFRAERKAGELLASMVERGGDRKSPQAPKGPRLIDLGVTPKESSNWQRMARVPEAAFEEYVQSSTRYGREISQIGVLRLGRAENVGRRKPSKKGARAGRTGSAAVRRAARPLFEELAEQVDLLERQLKGVLDGDAPQLTANQRRQTARTIADLRATLSALTALVLQAPGERNLVDGHAS